ncbi:ABC transporter transmembrane domain-containing protein [Rubricoccus marinus]|uniref:ABC transporter ATP-binding protein n=1 Tax=Rubricoccus marinus TaxID=716817 RepID=A0A259TU99_9BACT|nr:ABC transporter transmembrane domain-containing protein [Rubricoccus marinus]OZC01352.1 hypothetical protein BSZ36_18100 [Rubricoccus marinus]
MASETPGLRRSLADLRRLARLFRSEWPALRRAGALSVVSGGLGLLAPVLVAVLFDRVYPAGNVSLLGLVVLGIIAATAGEGVTRNLYRFAAFAARTRMRDVARLALFNHVLHLPSRVLESRRSGEIANRFGDVRDVLDTGADAALTAMSQSVYLIAVPPILFLIEPRLALVALVAVPITAAITATLGTMANRRWATTYDAYDEWAAFRVEAIREARTFKSMGCEAALYRRAQRHVAQAHEGTVAATGLWYICNSANAVVRALHIAALTYVGWRLVLSGGLTLGGYVAFQAYAALLLAPLSALIDAGGKLQKSAVSLGRVFDLADEPPEADPAATIARAEGVARHKRVAYTGRVRMRGVRFRYAPDAPGLDLDRLDLAPGEVVALVGPSDCGKTTALRLLGQVERPDAGAIEAEIDGDHATTWTLIGDAPGWRDRVAVCWQEPGLLSASVRDNLLVAAEDVARREISDAEIHAVLDACHLGDRVRELARQSAAADGGTDDPLDVALTEGAASISAGERQRLALLDEAATNLDAATAHAVLTCVLDELRSHPEPPAVVLVSHQPEHAALTDRTVRLGARPVAGMHTSSGDGRAGALPALTS